MEKFYAKALAGRDDFKRRLERVEAEVKKTMSYFGEKPEPAESRKFFETIYAFCKAYKRAEHENEAREKEHARRLANAAAMKARKKPAATSSKALSPATKIARFRIRGGPQSP